VTTKINTVLAPYERLAYFTALRKKGESLSCPSLRLACQLEEGTISDISYIYIIRLASKRDPILVPAQRPVWRFIAARKYKGDC